MDKYCIWLLILLAFLVFLDNRNNTEGFGAFGDAGAPANFASDGGENLQGKPLNNVGEKGEKEETDDQVKYVPIGLQPQKVVMEPPPSMVDSLNALSGAPVNMHSFMLLGMDEMVGSKTIDSSVPMPYPRVGAPDNLGRDTSFEEPEEEVQVYPGYDGSPEPKLTVDQQIQHSKGEQAVGKGEQAVGKGEQAVGKGSRGKVGVDIVYAPWCGWSKKSLPDFEKMDEKLNNLSPSETNGWDVSCNIYDSETPEGKQKAKDLDVKGFPSVLVNVNGEHTEGPRGYDDMISFINEITGANIQA